MTTEVRSLGSTVETRVLPSIEIPAQMDLEVAFSTLAHIGTTYQDWVDDELSQELHAWILDFFDIDFCEHSDIVTPQVVELVNDLKETLAAASFNEITHPFAHVMLQWSRALPSYINELVDDLQFALTIPEPPKAPVTPLQSDPSALLRHMMAQSDLRLQHSRKHLAADKTAIAAKISDLEEAIGLRTMLNRGLLEDRLGVNAAIAESERMRQANTNDLETLEAVIADKCERLDAATAKMQAAFDKASADQAALQAKARIAIAAKNARITALEQEIAAQEFRCATLQMENDRLLGEWPAKEAILIQQIETDAAAHDQDYRKREAVDAQLTAECERIRAEYDKALKYCNSIIDQYNALCATIR